MRTRPVQGSYSLIFQIYKIIIAALIFFILGHYTPLSQPLNSRFVLARSDQATWSEPIRLSEPDIVAWAPTITTDPKGNVHVMWSQTMTKAPVGEGDTLFYARYDGSQWTRPADVLVSPDGDAEFPEIAVTPDGILHAVWGTGGRDSRLMYAHSPAQQAGDPRSWSKPVVLGGPVNLTTSLVADAHGRLHAAFASLESDNLVYLRSDDGGKTWPVWVEIPGKVSQVDDLAAYPRLAVDGRGRVHAAWSVLPFPERFVMYARSDDGGDSWNDPVIIDSIDRPDYLQGYGPTYIDVETAGDEMVHLLWDGAPDVRRTHVWSSDGGNTWSARQLLFPEITGAGRAGWNDMVIDSTGKLHAVALKQPWYASWADGTWSNSMDIGHMDTTAEWVRIALGLGNQLHVVWVRKTGGEVFSVWYVHGEAAAPGTAPQPLSTPTPSFEPTRDSSKATIANISGTPVALPATLQVQPEQSSQTNSALPVFLGLLPGVTVVAIIFMIQTSRANLRRK